MGIDIGYEIIPSIYNGFLLCGKTFVSDEEFYLLHLDSTGMVTSEQPVIGNRLSVNIFPNPFSERATIEVISNQSSIIGSELIVYDVLAREIRHVPITDHFSPIIRGNLKSGIYFYELKNNENKICSGKFAVQ